jgi:hypothetical protein
MTRSISISVRRAGAAALILAASLSAQGVYNPATGKHYALTPVAGTLAQARQWADLMGGKLASVGGAAEQAFLGAVFAAELNDDGSLFIGLSDEALEGSFAWDDGTPAGFANWLPGEPNDAAGDEDATEMLGASWGYGWNDVAATTRRRGIVEAPLIVDLPATQEFGESFGPSTTGWTLDAEWQIAPATPSVASGFGFGDPSTDGSGTFGGYLAGVVVGGNAATFLHPARHLTSPTIPTTVGVGERVSLRFRRWLNSDYVPFMESFVEAYDGSAWHRLWTNDGTAVIDAAWRTVAYDVTPYVGPNFKVRFGFSIGHAAVYSVSSWNLDNVEIVKFARRPTLALYAPTGPGSLAFHNVGCRPFSTAITAATVNTAGFPNGWLFGISPNFLELDAQLNSGAPPFVNAIAFGHSSQWTYAGFVPPGIGLAAVTLTFGGFGEFLGASDPVLYVTP